MLLNNKYTNIEVINSTSSTVVSRATQIKDKKGVILKVLRQEFRNEYKLTQFINEETILSKLNSKYIVKLLDVLSSPNIYCHVFEDIGADSLYNILLTHKFSIKESLDIAYTLTKTVRYLHDKGIIHADINPKNIIYNKKTKELQIIDFGLSLIENDLLSGNYSQVISSANLYYISPEQTGLSKYNIDNRTDTYSLGLTLYHLFYAKTPFEAQNKRSLIHKHLAKTLKPLHEIDTKFPKVLSDIIQKMVLKKPMNRYQTYDSILYDLEKCINLLDKKNNIDYFNIAETDVQNIHIGDQLFGRDEEIKSLNKLYKKTVVDEPIYLIITGSSGIGKTSLLKKYFASFDTQRFNIIKGKFNQFNTHIPYYGFRQFFKQLNTRLMTHGYSGIKDKISKNSADVLVSFFPEIQSILEATKKYHNNISENTIDKLPFAMQELFSIIATDNHPIIIFFDDLQWIDHASSDLIIKTILNMQNKYIHFITAYRDQEIKNNNNALEVLKVLKSNKSYPFLEINLLALDIEQFTLMIQSLFKDTTKDLNKLSKIIFDKTHGNPFDFKTFIEYLIDKKVLYFINGKWKYDLLVIKTYSSSLNIARIIINKFNKLTDKQRIYLQYLAILGNNLDINLCHKIIDGSGQSLNYMNEVSSIGFINIYSNQHHFVHDKVQEYIISTISKELKYKINLKIGLYLERMYDEKKYTDVVTITKHLNNAYPTNKIPKKLFKLNIKALDTLLLNNSYLFALKRLQWIQTHFNIANLSNQTHTTSFHFEILKIKILYQNSQLTQAYKEVNKLIKKTKNVKENLICFSLLKDICVTQGKDFNKLVELGNLLLGELGIRVPESSTDLDVESNKLNKNISKHEFYKKPENILNFKTIQNTKHKQILSLLVDYWEASYYLSDISLMQWSSLKMIQHSFKYGNSSESCFAYVLYGAGLIKQQEYKKGYEFAQISLKLNQSFNDSSMLPKIYNFMANFISPYTKALSKNISLYQISLQQSKINGNIIFGTWANFLMHFSDYLSGSSLKHLRLKIEQENDFILNSGDVKMIYIFNILIRTLDELQYGNVNYEKDAESILLFDEIKFIPALAWFAILKAQTCFLNNELEKGLKYLEKNVYSTDNEIIMFPKIRLHFIRALLLLGKKDPLTMVQKQVLSSDLDEHKNYAKHTPNNFAFETLLLDAESNKDIVSIWDTASKYDKALKQAKKIKNSFYTSIASLCAGRFWKRSNYQDMVDLYYNEATVSLNIWGANAVSDTLKNTLPSNTPTEGLLNQSTNSSSSIFQPSNLENLLKSFYEISKSRDTNELIKTLMGIILETATATKAVFILRNKNSFMVKADMNFEEDKIKTLNVSLDNYRNIPKEVIYYSINTKKTLILQNPSKNGNFKHDSYIKKHAPASSTVIPIKLNDKVSGALYLENSEIFTPLSSETKKTIQTLLTQTAIIFKNTTLYETLKSSEENLNEAEQISHIGSWSYNTITKKIVFSAETYRIFDLEPFSVDVDYDLFSSFLHKKDKDNVYNLVNRPIDENINDDIIYHVITAKNKIKTLHQLSKHYVEDNVHKVSSIIRDITDIEYTQNQISKLSQAIDQNPFSTIIADLYGNIEYVNTQCLYITGYSKDELIGKNMHIFNSGKQNENFYESFWDKISNKKETWRGTIINKMKDGTLLDFDSTIFPIFDLNNNIINYVAIQEDITQQKIKDKLFIMQNRQAQMGEMISMIAHQWRQPLSIISTLVANEQLSIELDSFSMDELSLCFNDITEQVQHLSHTINDFRDFFKPTKKASTTNSSILINKAIKLIKHSFNIKGIKIDIHTISDPKYKTFENELQQVILNILKNAQDAFTGSNVKNQYIIIIIDKDSDNAIISIEDNAKGIDKKVIETLFLPYVSTKTTQNGTGLGLYMSKTIIHEHCKGTLDAQNTEVGAKFTIKIPLQD